MCDENIVGWCGAQKDEVGGCEAMELSTGLCGRVVSTTTHLVGVWTEEAGDQTPASGGKGAQSAQYTLPIGLLWDRAHGIVAPTGLPFAQ